MTIYSVAVYRKRDDVRLDFYDALFIELEDAEVYADSLRSQFNVIIKKMVTK